MPKDRLAALKKARVQRTDSEDEDEDTVFLMYKSGFMENFFEMTDEIRSKIEDIAANVKEVKLKHSTLLSTPQNDESTKGELEDLTLVIKKDAKGVQGQLKAIADNIKEDEEKNASSEAGLRIQQIQYESLSRRFSEVMNDYMACQLDYCERCKDRFQRQLEIVGKRVTTEELETMMESGSASIFTQDIVTETEQAIYTLKDIETRHSDLLQLERSIRELHELFVYIAVTVETQGQVLNRIEDNVLSAKEYTGSASDNVKKAVKYQTKARRKKLLLIFGVSTLILVVVIVVVLILLVA